MNTSRLDQDIRDAEKLQQNILRAEGNGEALKRELHRDFKITPEHLDSEIAKREQRLQQISAEYEQMHQEYDSQQWPVNG